MSKPTQRAFRLLKDLPMLPTGVVFVLSKHIPLNICLAWDGDDCQRIGDHYWAGGAFNMPSQVVKERDWFKEIDNAKGRYNA